jgi:hypothetical protein
MTFDDALHLLGMDVTFGAFVPLEEMMSPSNLTAFNGDL